jgi:hypothetical protein
LEHEKRDGTTAGHTETPLSYLMHCLKGELFWRGKYSVLGHELSTKNKEKILEDRYL